MRSTIHAVSPRDYWQFADGVGPSREAWWLRTHGRRFGAAELDGVAGRLRLELRGRTWHRDELGELFRSHGSTIWSGAWVALVRVPPSGTWERRRADLFRLADEWLGPSEMDEEQGLEHLLRRYLGAFGPAKLADAAGWAGVPVAKLRPAADRLRLRTFRDEHGKTLSTSNARRCRPPTRLPRSASCRRGTRRCSCMPAAPGSCPRSTASSSSTRRTPSRQRRSSSTAASRAPGGPSEAARPRRSSSIRSSRCRGGSAGSSPKKATGCSASSSPKRAPIVFADERDDPSRHLFVRGRRARQGLVPARRALGRGAASLYAERFDTVEIDSSFYRLPTEETTAAWATRVPTILSFTSRRSRR